MSEIVLEFDEHLKIEADKQEAEEGEFVYLYVRIEPGYEIDYISANDNEISDMGFIMPDSMVTVKARSRPKIYHIILDPCKCGKLIVDKTEAEYGELVCLKLLADNGYYPGVIYSDGVNIYNNTEYGMCFNMPANDIHLSASFVKVKQPLYKVGQQVSIVRAGNAIPSGTSFADFHIGDIAIINRIIWAANCELEKCCYQVQSLSGEHLGYYEERALKPINESTIFGINGVVKIIGPGNSKADGTGFKTYGIGWRAKVLSYDPHDEFPYKLGVHNKIQGYYKEEAIGG